MHMLHYAHAPCTPMAAIAASNKETRLLTTDVGRWKHNFHNFHSANYT